MTDKKEELTKHLYAYKYRLYPTESQKIFIEKHFGCSRFVYNWALDLKIKAYEKDKTSISSSEIGKMLTELKKDNPFLTEVASPCLGWALRNLDTAFQNFFRRVKKGESGFPKFKSKYNNIKSYQFHQYHKLHIDDDKWKGWITPPKFDTAFKKEWIDDPKIKMVTHRKPPATSIPKTVTISKTPSGEYYASILYEWKSKEQHRYPSYSGEKIIGVDLGIKDFLITSEGDKYNLSGDIIKINEKVKRLEKKRSLRFLRNDKKRSNRYKKLNQKIAKNKRYISKLREQNHYDIIHNLINKHNPNTIVIETLKVRNMMKNKKLSYHIGLRGWSMFITKLEHKCDERGINLVKLDQWFPSSQLCSSCGHKNDKVKNLSVREWKCDNCGEYHDRDVNASKNIMQKGKELLDIHV